MKRSLAEVITAAALEVLAVDERGFSEYYKLDPGVKIKDVIARYAADGDKVSDSSMPALFPLSEVWPHREYTWTRDNARAGFAIVDGKRVELSGPLKWDAIAADMKANGWRLSEQPCILIIGSDGSSKVGEGNHRLAIAKEIGLKKIPVRFEFYSGKVTKTPMAYDAPVPEVKKREMQRIVKDAKPKTPAEQKQIDDLLDLLGVK